MFAFALTPSDLEFKVQRKEMKIILPGGSGQVGAIIARAFVRDGHEVVVLSRKPSPAKWKVVEWDARTSGEWIKEFESADVVINLAGRSVNCRYSPENRRAIMESRVNSTRIVGQAIAPPRFKHRRRNG